MNMVKVEIDVEDYIGMLENRRNEFYVKAPDCIMEYYYEILRDGCIPDPQHADPSYIVDNIAVNGDYPLIRECYYKDSFIELVNDCYNENDKTFNIYKNMDEIETKSNGGYAIVADDMETLTLKEAEFSLEEFMKDHMLEAYHYETLEDENKIILYVTATDDYIENDCKPLEELFNDIADNTLLGIKSFEIINKDNLDYKIQINCVPLPEDMYIIYSL